MSEKMEIIVDQWRERVQELETLLQSEQHARFAAEQDTAHWREKCEEIQAERDEIWNGWTESHKLNDDLVETRVKQEIRIQELLSICLDCWAQFADRHPDGSRHSGGLDVLYGLRLALQEAGLIDEAGRMKT